MDLVLVTDARLALAVASWPGVRTIAPDRDTGLLPDHVSVHHCRRNIQSSLRALERLQLPESGIQAAERVQGSEKLTEVQSRHALLDLSPLFPSLAYPALPVLFPLKSSPQKLFGTVLSALSPLLRCLALPALPVLLPLMLSP